MIRVLYIVVLVFVCCMSNAQNKSGQDFFEKIGSSQESEGSLQVIQSPEISDLVGIHLDMNNRAGGIDGFRIQLYLGSNNNAKKEASEVKAKVLSLFQDEKIYVMYEAPFWRVQVGDFRSKSESLELYRKLKKEFPSCYPVPVDNIQLTSLDNNNVSN
ncbi:SPOR domain-containing protein [Plebeiibacterium sediminum]|uniref:SPOR domain-containing protein n=1 Tax=Plebeiibacterium sediminum TaxID=2992112 RepID=A0AAE3SH64_9BACT|nr:SPOR domain-containing protein [Plebeiobacterium sediminum]MCW3787998.1 SPOR domain-containing protein [Plebeiobacterium sediminum]